MWHRLGSSLDDPAVIKALPRYVDIVKRKKMAKFIIDKAILADFDVNFAGDKLWALHDRLLQRYPSFEADFDRGIEHKEASKSFLDLKAELGRGIMSNCHFCERGCRVDRLGGLKGYCGCGGEFAVSSCFPHMGEEPELVPSGTVFTSGCSIRCIHCQNYDISQWHDKGTSITPDRMKVLVNRLVDEGCKNINMVGGEPTPNAWLWIETFRNIDRNVATVWNSNSYYSKETALLLAGFIDVYLLDFKYGNNKCALELSDAPGYWEASTRNHIDAKKYGEIIVRVLVLPGHNECCTKPILNWISKNLGEWTRVNLMFQYRPEWRAKERPDMCRRLTQEEIDEALRLARDAGLKNLVH